MKSLKKTFLIIMVIFTFLLSPFSAFAENGNTIVYITRTGQCYHRDHCSYLKSRIETTLSSAVASGYRACSRCKPPQLDMTPTPNYNSSSQQNYISNSTPSYNYNSENIYSNATKYADICMGDSGPQVLDLQKRLVELGYNTNGVDGNFGEGTYAAIIKFQSDHKLEITGVADAITQSLLF